jgi:glycosyltransferase involved in cell wall biosynthesis
MLVAGSHRHAYRVTSALHTLALLPRARLLIAGRLAWSSSALEDVGTLASELDVSDRVEMLGPYAQRAAPAVFQRAHVLVHTQYNDACPSVVLEAMACGLPVVYSNSGGTPELVGDDAGVGVAVAEDWEREQVPEPAALAEAVTMVASRRAEMGAAARQRAVERFDVEPWLDRHTYVFERIVR